MSTILVAYATMSGSTTEVAHTIGDEIAGKGPHTWMYSRLKWSVLSIHSMPSSSANRWLWAGSLPELFWKV